jgi:hypothetical protein
MFQRSAAIDKFRLNALQYSKKRAFEQVDDDIPPQKFVEGVIDLEPTDKESVKRSLQIREDALPTKNVLISVDPETGQKHYERRKEKESNAFITLNTHQIPKIGTNEKELQLALELVINKLFSEQELQTWIEIKEPFASKGDRVTLDFQSEKCVFKSLKRIIGIEIGPINQMLHAHIIVELAHYTLINYNGAAFGLRAAELWRGIFPMDLASDRGKDVEMKTLLDCYREEKQAGAIQKDFTINQVALYGEQHPQFYHKTGRPALPQFWRGFHRIRNTGQIKTFFKHQGMFHPKATNRKALEQYCRKYIEQHYEDLVKDEEMTLYHTKSMYCQIQITQSNAEKARMNYISKNKAGAEVGVTRLSTMQTEAPHSS